MRCALFQTRRFRWRPMTCRHVSPTARSRSGSPSRQTKKSTALAWTSSPCDGQARRFNSTSITGVAGRVGPTRPVPFYVSTRGYGVFIDTARYVTVTRRRRRATGRASETSGDRSHHGRRGWSCEPAVRFHRGAGAGRRRGRVRLCRTDHDGGGPPLQLVWRRRRAAAEVGPRVHDAHANRVHRRSRSSTKSPSSGSAASRWTCSAWNPGWHDHAYPTSFEWSPVRFPNPRGVSRRARAAARARELVVQPVRVADRAAIQEAPAVCRLAPCMERHRPGLLDAGGASQIFADHLREKVVGLSPALGGFKVDEVDGFDALAVAGSGDLSIRPRRRAVAPDLRPARPAAADGPVSRAQPPHAGPGARDQRRGVVVPLCHLQRQLRVRRVHHRRGQQRLCRRALVAGSARRPRRGHAAPDPGGVLLAAGALQRMGHRHEVVDPRRGRRSTFVPPSRCGCGCCRTGTRRLRSTGTRARR